MAVTTLNIAESIRPWMSAGLQWYLADTVEAEITDSVDTDHTAHHNTHADSTGIGNGLTTESTNPIGQPSAQRSGNHVQSFSQAPAQTPTTPQSKGTGPQNSYARPMPEYPGHYDSRQTGTQSQTGASDKALRPSHQTDTDSAVNEPNRSSIRKDAPLLQPSEISPEQWPAEWQTMWKKVVPSSPIVWTYWSLGEDLGGKANPKRSNLLKTIISQLHLPKGSNTFWPVAVLRDSQNAAATQGTDPNNQRSSDSAGQTANEPQLIPVADAPIFLAGILHIRPKYIITFGSKALHEFAPNSGLGPYMQTQFMGCKLIALPDMDRMVDDMKHVSAIVAYLRTAISIRR